MGAVEIARRTSGGCSARWHQQQCFGPQGCDGLRSGNQSMLRRMKSTAASALTLGFLQSCCLRQQLRPCCRSGIAHADFAIACPRAQLLQQSGLAPWQLCQFPPILMTTGLETSQCSLLLPHTRRCQMHQSIHECLGLGVGKRKSHSSFEGNIPTMPHLLWPPGSGAHNDLVPWGWRVGRTICGGMYAQAG